ncbi:HD-GYP domain-containing protein [Rossellomorea marisflavi]|uniref:HD-GYP domain-containing protein n=2 Tax=Rossellomorea marisflavi TaxID=189381 RepID=UPI00064E1D26|nr:HD-GYP domain-containing protein [Rossellomorea marisflavi]KML35038.1 histidine kinase [Rossellomorea marisflavi]USK91293.1 HD-GYP domain-containing protein [Rossellomorea marisflavi]
MMLISTRSIRSGMVLGSPVYNMRGKMLIHDRVPLTDRMIQRLLELNIQYVYIEDSLSHGIEVKETVSKKVRQETIKSIEKAFSQVKQSGIPKSVLFEESARQMTGIIGVVLQEVKENNDLLTILTDVFSYDSYIFHHSFNVTLYTLSIGLKLNLPQKQLEQLGVGAILHDIGKMCISEEILMKPGRLTEAEFAEIKLHSERGFEILRGLHSVSILVAHCAYQHHERLDGSGYPRGIKEEDIHPFAKIIAVADVFDAMTSNRVYRDAMLPHQALEILYAGAGTLFDREVIEAFRRSVAIYPNGMIIELNDDRKAIVAEQNQGVTDRPVVRIVEERGERLENPYEIDLSKEFDIIITGFDPDFEVGIPSRT